MVSKIFILNLDDADGKEANVKMHFVAHMTF